MYGEIKGLTLYDPVNYNHTLYRSVFIVICPIVNFKEAPLTHSVFIICKTGMPYYGFRHMFHYCEKIMTITHGMVVVVVLVFAKEILILNMKYVNY